MITTLIADAKDNWVKYARTFVPLIAGGIIAALSGVGIDVDSAALEIVVDGLVTGVAGILYYFAVNQFSRLNPKIQILNGAIKAPVYVEPQSYDEVIEGLQRSGVT